MKFVKIAIAFHMHFHADSLNPFDPSDNASMLVRCDLKLNEHTALEIYSCLRRAVVKNVRIKGFYHLSCRVSESDMKLEASPSCI